MTKRIFSLFLTFCICLSVFVGVFPAQAQNAETQITLDNVENDGSYLRVSLTFDDIASDCVMYAGIYGQSGIMKQVNKFSFQRGSLESITLRIPAANIDETDLVKIFFFDAQNGVKPLCKNMSFSSASSHTKLNGVITRTCRYSDMYPDEAGFLITDTYDNADWAGKEFTTVYMSLADGVIADDYYGISADIYFSEVSGGKYEITDIIPDGLTETVSLSIEGIDDSSNNNVIYYYESEESIKTVSYSLSSGVLFYSNYESVESLDDIIRDNAGYINAERDVEITLINNDGDFYYDMVIAKERTYDIVASVDAEAGLIETESGNLIRLYFDDSDIQTSIVDTDGTPIALESLCEGDAIAIMSDGEFDYRWMEVINLGDAFCVNGMVDGLNSGKVYIDGVPYANLTGIDLQLGDAGIFYLTLGGKIFYYKMQVLADYGYILNAELSTTAFSEAWIVKILTADNRIEEYTVADKIEYDGFSYDECGDALWSDSPNFPLNNIYGSYTNNCTRRFVSYNINSGGFIYKINTETIEDVGVVEYAESSQTLGYSLEDDAVIFNINPDDEDSPYAGGLDILIDNNEYGAYIMRDSDNEFSGAVIYSGECNYTAPEPVLSDPEYGYILATAMSYSGFSQNWQIKILDQNNKSAVYNVADRFVIDSAAYDADYYGDFLLRNLEYTNMDTNISDRIISYSTDEDGNIKVINTFSTDAFEEAYNISDSTLGAEVDNETIVFDISLYTYDEPYVADKSVLIDQCIYTGYIVAYKYSVAECVVLTSGETNYEPPAADFTVGYIINAGFSSSGFSQNWMLSIVDESGENMTYTVSDRYEIDGVRYYGDEKSMLTEIASTDSLQNPQCRLVDFIVDSDGYITKIFTLTGEEERGIYNSDTQTIGGVAVSDDVKILVIGNYSYVTDINFLVNNGEYKYVCTENRDYEIDVIAITYYSTRIDYAQSVGVVSEVTDVLYDSVDGTVAKKVEYYSNGEAEAKSITIVDDSDISWGENCRYDDIAPGAMIMFTDNGRGVACAYTVLAVAESAREASIPAYYLNMDAIEEYVRFDKDNGIIVGYIENFYSKNSKKIVGITADHYYVSDNNGGITEEDFYELVVGNDVNSYTYINDNPSAPEIIAGDWLGSEKIDIAYEGMATYFIAFTEDIEVTDLITFSDRKIIEEVSAY